MLKKELYYYNKDLKLAEYNIPNEILNKKIFDKWKIAIMLDRKQYYYNIISKISQLDIPYEILNNIIFNHSI